MEAIGQVLLHTPWWVLALLVFLITRGGMFALKSRPRRPSVWDEAQSRWPRGLHVDR